MSDAKEREEFEIALSERDIWKSRAEGMRESAAIAWAEVERLRELEAAVKALPVKEWVEREADGEPYLMGYVMQARGEWDRVRKALAASPAEKGAEIERLREGVRNMYYSRHYPDEIKEMAKSLISLVEDNP